MWFFREPLAFSHGESKVNRDGSIYRLSNNQADKLSQDEVLFDQFHKYKEERLIRDRRWRKRSLLDLKLNDFLRYLWKKLDLCDFILKFKLTDEDNDSEAFTKNV